MSLHSEHALILKRTPYGESSLVVQVLTQSGRRVHLLARGAYRPRSQYFCILDFFDTLQLSWSKSRSSDLGLLRKGSCSLRRSALTRDLRRYKLALAVLELCQAAAQHEQPDPQLFTSLEAALDGLQSPAYDPDLIWVVFQLEFLRTIGLAPALQTCAQCAGPAPALHSDRVPFSAGAGGRLCASHATEARQSGHRVGTLPANVLECAQHLSLQSPRGPAQPAPPAELLLRVRDLTTRFIDYHLETRLRTQREFLAASNRNAPQAERQTP